MAIMRKLFILMSLYTKEACNQTEMYYLLYIAIIISI